VPPYGGLGGCSRGSGDVDHVGGEIDAGDRARQPGGFGREPGDDAGTAGDVEDALAGLQTGGLEQASRHRRGDGRHEVALVVLSSSAGEVTIGDSAHLQVLSHPAASRSAVA
jgi:hypothetical protein